MSEQSELLYGWYSNEQAKTCQDLYVYRDATSGKEVTLTCVSATKDHGCLCPDMKLVAMVRGFVRNFRNPNCGYSMRDLKFSYEK